MTTQRRNNVFHEGPVSEFTANDEGFGVKATCENVDHPNHYQSSSGLEVIDVIKAFTEDLTGIQAVCTANVLKYTCRWHKKNGVEDLLKAKKYIDFLIDSIE